MDLLKIMVIVLIIINCSIFVLFNWDIRYCILFFLRCKSFVCYLLFLLREFFIIRNVENVNLEFS